MGKCHMCKQGDVRNVDTVVVSLHVRKRLIKAFFLYQNTSRTKADRRYWIERTERRIHRERKKGTGNGNSQDGQVLASKQE